MLLAQSISGPEDLLARLDSGQIFCIIVVTIALTGAFFIVSMLANVGGMHSGLSPSPVSLFFRQVLLPRVMRVVQPAGSSS